MITMKEGEIYREYNPVLDKTIVYRLDRVDFDEDGELESYTCEYVREYSGKEE